MPSQKLRDGTNEVHPLPGMRELPRGRDHTTDQGVTILKDANTVQLSRAAWNELVWPIETGRSAPSNRVCADEPHTGADHLHRPQDYAPARLREAARYLLDRRDATEEESRLATEALGWLRSKRDEPKQTAVKPRSQRILPT